MNARTVPHITTWIFNRVLSKVQGICSKPNYGSQILYLKTSSFYFKLGGIGLHKIPFFYRLVIVFMLISISLMTIYLLLLGSVSPFPVASSIGAVEIIKTGHLPLADVTPSQYWNNAMEFERNYPIPSLILAVLHMITGMPLNVLPYIPLLISFIPIYYSLAYLFLSSKYFSLLYSTFSAFYLMTLLYVCRVSLGIMIATSILYLLLRVVSIKSFRNKVGGTLITTNLLAIALSFTYYTTTFMLIFLCSILLVCSLIVRFQSNSFSSSKLTLNLKINTTFILALFLVLVIGFMSNQYLYIYASSGRVSLELWLRSIYLSMKEALNLETKGAYIAPSYSYDYFTCILKKLFQVTEVLSIVSIPIVILLHLVTKLKHKLLPKISSLASFATVIILLYIGELLFYTGTGQFIWSVRYLILYGSVIFLGLVNLFTLKFKPSKRAVVCYIFGIFVLMGSLGNFLDKAYYFWNPTSRFYYNAFTGFCTAGNASMTFYSDPITASAITYRAKIHNLMFSFIPWGMRIFDSLLENDLESLKGMNILFFLTRTPLFPEAATPLYARKTLYINEKTLAFSNIIYNCGRLYVLIF